MSKRLLAFFLSFSLGFSSIFGQIGTNVHGVVLDKDSKECIVGAILRLRDTSGNQLGYSVTDINGNFSILSNIALDGLSLYVQSMGYSTDTIILKGVTFPLKVRLSQKATQLRDVIVRAPDIEQRSDTLIYNMSKYAKAQDRKLADVLKRLPGIKVEESGEIKYNGEPINKLYIDGNDFMDGRYGLATENITPDDVASVEVYENHQPVKALEGLEFSQQAGLNIKLREEARHRWIGLLDGGLGGSPFAYNASAFGMRIAGKWQSMETVRANNSGWNPMSQSQQFTLDRIFSGPYISDLWDDNITAGQPSYPLEESRTRDNSSFLVNASNAWSVGKEKTLRFNFTCLSDKLDYRNGYETDYLDETLPSYSETNTMDYRKQGINGTLNYTKNGKTTFLKDNLSLDATWNESRSSIAGTLSLSQRVKEDALSAINDLQAVKRMKDRMLTISSRNSYSYTSQDLSAMRDEARLQTLSSHDLRSSTELKYGWTKTRWYIYGRAGVDANYHTLQSELSAGRQNIEHKVTQTFSDLMHMFHRRPNIKS